MAIHPPSRCRTKTGQPFRVRSADIPDAKSLLALIRAVVADGEGQVIEPDELSHTEASEHVWIAQHRDHASWLALVAELEGMVVGVLNFKTQARRRLSHGGAFGMSVHPAHRGKGVGGALLSHLVRWAHRAPQVTKVALAVRADNTRALALYEAQGFVEEGRRSGEIRLPDGALVDDVLMYRMVASPPTAPSRARSQAAPASMRPTPTRPQRTSAGPPEGGPALEG